MTFLEIKNAEAKSRSRDDDGRISTADPPPRASAGRKDTRADGETRSDAFHSILFATPEDRVDKSLEAPVFFVDLNCDQVVDAITAGREEYNLKPFFYAHLRRVDAIEYRQEVMQDLEQSALLRQVNAFAQEMRRMREHLGRAGKLHYKEQKQAWFLDAVEIYCDAITAFAESLSQLAINSRGLLRFRNYLTGYVGSALFTSLSAEAQRLKTDLATVHYNILIKGDSFTVSRYEVGDRLQRRR